MNEWLVVLLTSIFFVLVACVLLAATLGLWAAVHRTKGLAARLLRRAR